MSDKTDRAARLREKAGDIIADARFGAKHHGDGEMSFQDWIDSFVEDLPEDEQEEVAAIINSRLGRSSGLI